MTKRFPLSYSRLTTFEQCPAKFNYLYIEKTAVDHGNEYTEYGNRVHESLENYGKTHNEKYLTPETRKFKPIVDNVSAQPGMRYFERQLAIDAEGNPCDWFSKAVWFRAIVDVLIDAGDVVTILDWKTGAVKPDMTQLRVFAYMVHRHFPRAKRFKVAYVWLQHDDVTPSEFTAEQAVEGWKNIDARASVVDVAVETRVFPHKPGHLCKWCPAKKICPQV